MCTLAAWVGVFPGAPLVVAANRDEHLGRPSSGPAWREGARAYLAPKDEAAGGTWWALGETGLFVALTNRAGAMLEASRRSRGLLVTDAVETGSVAGAEALLRGLEPRAFNGFHLLATDGREAVRAIADGEKLEVTRLPPGRHLLTERGFGAAERSRDAFADGLLAPFDARPLDLDGLARALATHAPEPLEGLCVHVDSFEYGTRSSTILALGPAVRALRYAPGPPCRTRYEVLDAQLARVAPP